METSSTRVQVNKVESYNLWYHRLRHLSSQALSKCFSNIENDSCNKSIVCDVRPKQTRIPFPDNDNKAASSFDLIH